MKRIFTIIIILITISLFGIIVIQLSWLRNMILLQEEQIKEKVDRAVDLVGQELVQYKAGFPVPNMSPNNLFEDEFARELLRPTTIGKRFTVQDLEQKIRTAFNRVQLKNIHFEFMLGTVTPGSGIGGVVERQSRNFEKEYDDTIANYSKGYGLIAPSGSKAEGFTVEESLIILALDWKDFALRELRLRIIMAIIFTLIIIAAFALTVQTMLRQKKLGEIKNDFINNMTHEFKTPIATISLAVDAMKNERVLQDREKIAYFNSIIKEENQRMNRQVETILKASQLEKQEVDLNLQPLYAHKIITDVVDNFALQLQDRHGKAEVQLNAPVDLINADEVHFSNLVNNLIDNAVKYSKENVPLQVKISTEDDGKDFVMTVEDNGIGMSKETVKRVFERFYRAHTGNLHNVKGFGLGLSYVKTMVHAHGGHIKVESTLGKGSTFRLYFPLKKG